MRLFITVMSLFMLTTSYAQEIVKSNGLYGIEQYAFNSEGIAKVPAVFDSITYRETEMIKGYICYDSEKTLFYKVDKQYNLVQVKSEKANHFYFQENDNYGWDLIATDSQGNLYTLNPEIDNFELSESDMVLICRTGKQLQLFQNKKSVRAKSDDLIFPQDIKGFVAIKEKKYQFLNEKGIPYVDNWATSYKSDWRNKHLIYYRQGTKLGLINTKSNLHFSPTNATYPQYFLKAEEWSENMEFYSARLFAFEEDGKYGAKDFKGNTSIQANYEDIKITPEYIYCKKDGEWIIVIRGGQEIRSLHFDSFLGRNQDQLFIKRNDSILYFDFADEIFHPVEDAFWESDNIIIQSLENNKIGVLDANGAFSLPLVYDTYLKKEQVYAFKTDSGFVAYNSKLKLLCPFAFDEFWSFDDSEGYFVYRKGTQHGIFNADGDYNFGPYDFANPQASFRIDVEAHTGWEGQGMLIRNSKIGVINDKNQELIPFKYDDIRVSKNESGQQVMAFYKNENIVLYNLGLNESKEFSACKFVDFPSYSNGDYFILANSKGVFGVNQHDLSLKEEDLFEKKMTMVVPYDDYWSKGKKGVCDQNGDFIIGFELNEININTDSQGTTIAIGSEKDGTPIIVFEDGSKIRTPEYKDFNRLCTKNTTYIRVLGKNDLYALAKIENKQLKLISEFKYSRVACVTYRQEAHQAELSSADGKEEKFYFQGNRFEPIEE